MRLAQRAGTALVALAVAALPFVAGSPAQAAAPTAGVFPCLLDPQHDPAPLWRQHEDTPPVTATDLAAMPAEETTRTFVAREVSPQLAATVTIPVYVHVIKGTRPGERSTAGPRRVRRIIATLNGGFAGQQSALAAPTRYQFELRRIDYTRREGWYHAFLNGPRDKRMKRALHRGHSRSLNLYINGGGPRGFPILGWARFPWQYAHAHRLDGVTVNVAGLPGGQAYGYNLGDTVVHETGHWMGLFHTFQGGCGPRNDLVYDTPAEAEPSFYCETTRDSCLSPGLDPVHNFMDYSLDACMNSFTAGQVRRMDSAFARWRK